MKRHVAISGDLGSGKSTVATLLADRTGRRLWSTGALQRQVAQARGVDTLQANLAAESDASIDEQIDAALRAEGYSHLPTVFDSRMAWHFVPSAFKVHLVVAPAVGAGRMLARPVSAVERYENERVAKLAAGARAASERGRFLKSYKVDISRLRNYDAVVDTSDTAPEEVVSLLETMLSSDMSPRMWVSPRRVVPTGNCVRYLVPDGGHATAVEPGLQIRVCFAQPHFFVARDYRELSAALRSGATVVPAVLEAEGDEQIVGGLSAERYFEQETKLSYLYDWEDAHGFRFQEYPELLDVPATSPQT